MKSFKEIISSPRLTIRQCGEDGGQCTARLLSSYRREDAFIIFSNGGGWEHVSVSFAGRVPTWAEMCEVKDLFFWDYETVIQYHPKKEDYVNDHPFCLHLWRSLDEPMPTPPWFFVGRKKSVSVEETEKMANAYLDEYERRKKHDGKTD